MYSRLYAQGKIINIQHNFRMTSVKWYFGATKILRTQPTYVDFFEIRNVVITENGFHEFAVK